MKKVLFTAIAYICLFAGTSGLTAEASHWMDIRQSGLSGPVQSVTEEQQLLQSESKERIIIPLRSINYNTDGYAVRVRLYRGGTAFEDKGYVYDGQGRVTASGLYTKDGAFTQQVLHRYDAEGKLQESQYLSPNGSPFLIKRYSYQQARLAGEQHISSDGSVITAKQYEYSKDGQLTGVITLGQDGRLLAKELVSNTGRETDCQYSGDLKNYGRRIKIKTEADGRLSETCYLPDGSVYQNQICDTREGDGLKRTVHRADQTIASEAVYNAAGDMTSIRRYSADGNIELEEKFSYQYDSWGNWTERAVLRFDNTGSEWVETEKTIRQIRYF